MNLNIFINVPKLCVPTITKLIFLYLEINNVIDSGVKDQVLNPTDIEKNYVLDDCKPDFSNVLAEGSVNSVLEISGIYIFSKFAIPRYITCKAIKTLGFIKRIASKLKLPNK